MQPFFLINQHVKTRAETRECFKHGHFYALGWGFSQVCVGGSADSSVSGDHPPALGCMPSCWCPARVGKGPRLAHLEGLLLSSWGYLPERTPPEHVGKYRPWGAPGTELAQTGGG